MKKFLGNLIMILGFLSGLYVGGWLMFIQPIIECCQAFDANTLTGVMVGITVIKCVFAGTVGTIIAYIGFFIGAVFKEWR